MITMSELAAREHGADLRRAAQRRTPRAQHIATDVAAIELRPAGREDEDTVRRLAALDEAPELVGPVLLAFLNGRAVAALSQYDGSVVADPFVLTEPAVALLRLRARLLSGVPARSGLRRRLRLVAA
jgi:hypothetical protein